MDIRVIEVLETLGLSKNEITVYLDLLKKGKSSANDVSKRTKLHRSNIYDILEKLLEKGAVDKTNENEKSFFYPVPPIDLFGYFKQKEKEFEEIIPQLEKIQSEKPEKRTVVFSEGINSIKNIIDHLIDFKHPIYCFGFSENCKKTLSNFLGEFNRKRMKNKIEMKIILVSYNKEELENLNKMDCTEAKYISFQNKLITTYLCHDRVLIINWEEPSSIITIEDGLISRTYKEYFNFLWQSAKNAFMLV